MILVLALPFVVGVLGAVSLHWLRTRTTTMGAGLAVTLAVVMVIGAAGLVLGIVPSALVIGIVISLAITAFGLVETNQKVQRVSWHFDASSEACFQMLALAVAAVPKHTVTMTGPQTGVITRRQIPVWAIVLAVLLFPIGLLALIARKQTSLTLVLSPVGDGMTGATGSGIASPKLLAALDSASAGHRAPLTARTSEGGVEP